MRLRRSSLQSSTEQPPAIVIGVDDTRGVYVARTLAQRGVAVIGIAKNSSSYGTRTNACKEVVFGDLTGAGLVDVLLSLADRVDGRPVLFPCPDHTVRVLSEHRAVLGERFMLALPSVEAVNVLTDKVAFYSFAAANGFSIPETHFLATRADAERAASTLEFPCVLKPPSSRSPAWLAETHVKAFKAHSPDELLRLYDHYSAFARPLIVQRWIAGADATLYSCNCYLDAEAQPQVVFVSRKLRQWPPEIGETCLGQECRDDFVAQETVRLLQSVGGFRGLGYVEFKRDDTTGEYFIIEPNIGRPTARSGLAEATGVELLFTMYCDLVGRELPPDREQRFTGAKWVYFRRDLMSAYYYWRRGELTPREWARSLRGRKIEALFSWRDPGPFVTDVFQTGRAYISALERKKRDFGNPLPPASEA